jgi:hypothetical protein
MGTYQPLRLVFFIYDFFRLVIMTSLLVMFSPLASSHENGLFPYVFYAVPNGLFPLMSFFLCVNFWDYKPYIALYMAGKILAVVSVLAWFVFLLPRIALSFSMGSRTTFAVAGTALLLSIGDALSVLGGALLKKQIPDGAPPREPEIPSDLGSVNLGADEVPEEGNSCV